ncbi:MAG: methyltransferase domain-containing protein [Rhodothermales bacterium]
MRKTGHNQQEPPSGACPLCGHAGSAFQDGEYLSCPECGGLFRPRAAFLPATEEKARYEEHENDVLDDRYQAFVSPIVDAVLRYGRPTDRGLDFGSGTAPVIAHLLREHGFDIACYDPFFSNTPGLLEHTYDYIVCCEVIEHFYDPAAEFERLHDMLLPGGRLYCMTMLYHEGVDFPNWHYRRDPTHVFIYREETILWLAQRYGFSSATIDGRLIVLQR